MRTIFQERLFGLRNGITQKEFAQKAGISISTLYLLETGDIKPSKNVIKKISQAFNVDPEWLDGVVMTDKPARPDRPAPHERPARPEPARPKRK